MAATGGLVVPGRARERARARGRRHLNIRGKSANLPAITDRDWLDIKFGVDVGVDYYALSFVRNAEVIYELKHWLAQQGARARAPWRHNRILRVGLWRHVEAGCVLGPRRHARRRPPAAGARRGALRAHAAAACAPGARRGQRGQAGTRLRVRACRACGGPRRPLPCALMWGGRRRAAGASIGVLAKIESADSVGHLDEILDAVDGAMVARGDLGAELPVEQARAGPGPTLAACSRASVAAQREAAATSCVF